MPCLRLFTEPLLVDEGTSLKAEYREVDLPVLALSFAYPGFRVRAPVGSDDDDFGEPAADTRFDAERDHAGEARCQRLLESFGAVEIACLSDHQPLDDTEADYVLHVGGTIHSFCSFSAYAVPQLKKLGWQVSVDEKYPYRVLDGDVPWYACIEPGEELDDWFSLELGVEVSGQRVNLLEPLLELLSDAPEDTTLDALLNIPARFRALPAGQHGFIAVPVERLRKLLTILLELYRGERCAHGGVLHFPGLQAAALDKLDSAFHESGGAVEWHGCAELRARGQSFNRKPAEHDAPLVRSLRATLRPYQESGVNWLQSLRENEAGGVLADDMGLGKTLQTIAHLVMEKEARRMDAPSLIVVPTSLVGNWQVELKRFAPCLRVCVLHGPDRKSRFAELSRSDVVITTYPVLIRDLEALKEKRFHYLILDEAQAIKSRRSQAKQAVMALEARHRLALTGTPVENNLEELWSIFDFTLPGLLGSAEDFKKRFRIPVERDASERALLALRDRVAPFIMRRMKEHVARDLPPKTELVRPVELEHDQRDLYESIRVAGHVEVRRAIRKKGLTGSTITILDALMKLRQVCCDPRLVNVDAARSVRASAKYELLMELLEQQLAQGRRVLVFSQFAQMLALIAQGLHAKRLRYSVLTGSVVDRARPILAFQNGEVDIFLISLKAGGTGLNLTRADTVIHYDPWWNPAAQAQATDRAYRIGQTEPVFVYKLIAAGSVEERMLKLQQRKQRLADGILGGSAGKGTDLSLEEVDDLFAPLADRA
ncbi:MAG TPA: DEAD/DEAH box helicase [Polyangiaceae bacterium]